MIVYKDKISSIWHGDIYTVEPGYDECAKYLSILSRGGIGALSPLGTKYYDYDGFMPSLDNISSSSPDEVVFGPSLRDFLLMMDYVDEDVRFYCTTSRGKVYDYVRSYLNHFLTSEQAAEVWQKIHSYMNRHSHLESGYRANIVIGTPYFNNLFYETSWLVAQFLFSPALIESLQSSFINIRGFDPSFPSYKDFVNKFDGGETLQFFFDAPDNKCWMDDTLFIVSKDFHCSEKDFIKSLRPYVQFLSNWTLLLACILCMHAFGQCAFGIYWETGGTALVQKMQKEAWRGNRR
ncbi:hypothetical protein [uncultured Enorma sp.]|uniref:hypothetical protein n=1 Tax=uncultured Enorma sp. TaxID=1714346 RepID=UPI0028059AE1|nr:hypothetical protein [uncultured Enorma sp.]